MTDDVRIATSLRTHRKTKRLKRRIGEAGCWSLVCLFLFAGEQRWTGDLAGMSDEDIEEEADWGGDPGAFVAALVEVKFLVGESLGRRIHEWQDHNPYAASRGNRIEKGKRAANARWGRKDSPEDATGIEKNAPSMPAASPQQCQNENEQCPPAPTPTPTNSAPNGAGAVAPVEADPIWHTGLSFLLRKGIPNAQARQFLGKLKREAGDVDAAALLAQAETDDITEPIPWLSRAAVAARERRREGPKPGKQMQGLMALEGLKSGNRLDSGRSGNGAAEALPALAGPHSRG